MEIDIYFVLRLRTTTKWGTCFPQWREHMTIRDIKTTSGSLRFTVQDATKMGTDQEIGECRLPLHLLFNQKNTTFWLKLKEPSKLRTF